MNYILERENPFEYEKKELVNSVNQTKLSDESVQFMLECKELGQQNYADFYQSHLVKKSVKLFDNISKTRKTTKSKSGVIKYDMNKEAANFLRSKHLLTYELLSTSFYLTKNGYL